MVNAKLFEQIAVENKLKEIAKTTKYGYTTLLLTYESLVMNNVDNPIEKIEKCIKDRIELEFFTIAIRS